MPLNKPGLVADIKAMLNDTKNQETDQQKVIDNYANKLADAIEKFVKSGTVNSNVVTAGSPTAHTGTGVGTIS